MAMQGCATQVMARFCRNCCDQPGSEADTPIPMKSSILSRILAAVFSLSVLMGTSGCIAVAAGAAAGAGAVAWVRGELDANLTHGFDAVERATNRAVEQLEFAKVNEGKSAVDAEFTLRTGQDKKITIRLDRAGENMTRVRIRVGVVGDEVLSRTILDKIQANL